MGEKEKVGSSRDRPKMRGRGRRSGFRGGEGGRVRRRERKRVHRERKSPKNVREGEKRREKL